MEHILWAYIYIWAAGWEWGLCDFLLFSSLIAINQTIEGSNPTALQRMGLGSCIIFASVVWSLSSTGGAHMCLSVVGIHTCRFVYTGLYVWARHYCTRIFTWAPWFVSRSICSDVHTEMVFIVNKHHLFWYFAACREIHVVCVVFFVFFFLCFFFVMYICSLLTFILSVLMYSFVLSYVEEIKILYSL